MKGDSHVASAILTAKFFLLAYGITTCALLKGTVVSVKLPYLHYCFGVGSFLLFFNRFQLFFVT